MSSFTHNLQQNDKMLILLILTFEGSKNSYELLKYLPKNKEQIFKEEIDKLLNIQQPKRYSFLLKEIKSLQSNIQFSKIEYIHFSWLSDELQKEQPQIIAVILNSLPKDKTKQILSTFDVNLREKVTYPLQPILPGINEVIMERFEAKFLPMRAVKDTRYYKILISLKENDFFKLIRKMGLQELAIAFRGIDKLTLSKFTKSISPSDEKELLQMMKELKEIDYEKIKITQKNIWTYSHLFNTAKDIFWEIGLLKLAQLLKGEGDKIIQQIYQKLPKIEVNKLNQYLDKIESILSVEEKEKIILELVNK